MATRFTKGALISTGAAVIAAAIAISTLPDPPVVQSSPPNIHALIETTHYAGCLTPEHADQKSACLALRVLLHREVRLEIQRVRRQAMKDAAESIKVRLRDYRARNPKIKPSPSERETYRDPVPPGIEDVMHNLERRASE